MVLAINITSLALHVVLCVLLHVARDHLINNVCDQLYNFGQLLRLVSSERQLLLSLVVLCSMKLFFLPMLFHGSVGRVVRLVRAGVGASLWVLVALLLLAGVMAVLLTQFTHPATSTFLHALFTCLQVTVGLAHLPVAWPLLLVFRLLTMFLLLPLTVAVVWATLTTSLTTLRHDHHLTTDNNDGVVIRPAW